MFKWRFWSALNWPIHVGKFCNFQQLFKSRFLNALNWPIEACNFYKLEQSFKSRFWSALNWPIDVGNSCDLEQFDKSRIWSGLNWQLDVGNFAIWQHTTISQLIKSFHLENVSFVLWNLEIRGNCLVMGQLTFCLLHFREEVNVIKSLLNFDHILNSIQYGNSSCCKEYDNGSSQLGSKNGCPPKK